MNAYTDKQHDKAAEAVQTMQEARMDVKFAHYRYVHAARARTLRQAGRDVRFAYTSLTGRAVYKWWSA